MLVFSELKSAPSAFAPLSHVSLCVCVCGVWVHLFDFYILHIKHTAQHIYQNHINNNKRKPRKPQRKYTNRQTVGTLIAHSQSIELSSTNTFFRCVTKWN